MGAAYFYHLTRAPLEQTLPMLLDKARQAGWRIAVRGVDRARLEWLDERLWLGPEDGFLPHGLEGGPHDAAQPILLTTGGVLHSGHEPLGELMAKSLRDEFRVPVRWVEGAGAWRGSEC